MQIDVSALKSIFNPKLRPLIGVDVSSTAVKMVELADAGKGLQLMNVGSDMQSIIKGLVLLTAVAFDVYNKSQGKRSILGLMMRSKAATEKA